MYTTAHKHDALMLAGYFQQDYQRKYSISLQGNIGFVGS